MRAQLDRRGPAWIRGRGGLDRFLSNADAEAILEGLTSGDLDPDDFEQRLSVMSIEDQAVLLNLLGGRLPMGYRMVAGTAWVRASFSTVSIRCYGDWSELGA